jgi:internalin A
MGKVICYTSNDNGSEVTYADLNKIKEIDIGLVTSFTTLRDIKKLKNLEKLFLNVALVEGDPTDLQTTDAIPKPNNEQILSEFSNILKDLNHLSFLTIANFAGNINITNLDIVSKCKSLEVISITDTDITELSGLKNLKKLKRIYLENNEILDISDIKNLKNLKEVYLHHNKIEDISPLSNHKNIEILFLGNNNIKDISTLKNLENLTSLELDNNNIQDISSLSTFKNLRNVYLSGNNISDISPLLSLKNLKKIELTGNPVAKDEEQINKLKEKFPDAKIITTDDNQGN